MASIDYTVQWQHIDTKGWVITVPEEINKTHEYSVYANSRVEVVLKALFASRPERLRQPGSLVFAFRNGKPRKSIRTVWEAACREAEVEGLHVRGLRATAATRIQEGGGNELDVKMHLGHAAGSMGVTGRYLAPHEEHRRRIAELTIREWPSNVIEQWKNMRDRMRGLGLQVEVVPPDPALPGLVYPANAGFRLGSEFVLSNRTPTRAGEREVYRSVIDGLGIRCHCSQSSSSTRATITATPASAHSARTAARCSPTYP